MAFKRITTKYCLRKQQACLYSEKSFDIAAVALGTGSYESISDDIKSLKNEILRLPVNKLVQNGSQWTFKIYIAEVQENTYFKEIGVFDKEGNLLYYSECDFVMTSSVEGIPCQTAFTGVFELMQGLNAIVIDPSTEIASTNFVELNFQKLEEKGQANGYASLDNNGKVPEVQLPDMLSGLPVFCFNSGTVDENGESALCSLEGSIVTLYAPAVCTTANGKTYKIKENKTLNITGLVNENECLNIFYNVESKELEAYANKVTIGKTEPADFALLDIWVDTSVKPCKCLQKISENGNVECPLVWNAVVENVSGSIILYNKPFNRLGDKNTATVFPLFTPVIQDHILTGEEAKGYALQGTYVNKNSSPEIVGYPTFYDRCLEEKSASNPQLSSIHGALTYNNGILSGFNSNSANYAVISDVSFNPGSANWEAVFAFNTGELVEGSQWIINDDKAYQAFSLAKHSTGVFWCGGFVNNTSTYSFSLLGTHQVTENTDYLVKITQDSNGYKMFISTDDGVTWLLDATSTSTTAITAANLRIGGFESDLPFKGTFNCNKSYIKIGKTRFDNFWKYTNPNGHIFYDIADKDVVDAYFASTGIAWLYGIDSENERIFLPRAEICNFAQGKYPTTIPVGGNGKTLGFTNGPYNYGMSLTRNTENTCILHTQDYAQPIPSNNTTGYASGTPAASTRIGMTTDSSKSGVVAYTSGLAPRGATSYLYIVVGNTEQESAITDVTEITTSENDTIPLFTGQYFDFAPNNPSWLKAGTQQNSGGIYTSCYNTLVNCLTEANNIYNLKVIKTADMVAGTDYSEYWKVNQDETYFITPTKLSYKALNGGIKGNNKALGLTDGTNEYVLANDNGNYGLGANQYASYPVNAGTTGGTWQNLLGKTIGLNTVSSKSGIIAEESTAQLYFKVANAVQNLELLDAGEVLEALADKTDKVQAANAGMPSNRRIGLSLGASGTTYTAPADGYVYLEKVAGNTQVYINITTGGIVSEAMSSFSEQYLKVWAPVGKNNTFSVFYNATGNTKAFRFIYAEGAK